jgi:5-methyltetrahydropteroyltriglutamate--homocysteine methyltransferase
MSAASSSNATTPPRFRADIVGSFLCPACLLEAHERGVTGPELRAIEDHAIREVIQLQEAVRLPIVTDGEFRRGHWTLIVA